MYEKNVHFLEAIIHYRFFEISNKTTHVVLSFNWSNCMISWTNKTTKEVLYTYARMHCSCIVCTYVCISHMEVGRCNVDVQMKRCWLICSFVNAIKISQLICSSRQNSFPVWSCWIQTTNLTVYTRSCVLLYIVIYLFLDNGILLFRSHSFFSFCLHCDCNTCRRSLFFCGSISCAIYSTVIY